MIKNQQSNVLISKTPKTYKNKKLNTANFDNFTHTDYQVFLHLVSKIGGVDEVGKYLQPEQLERKHILTAKEFSEVFNADIDNSYRHLKKAGDILVQRSADTVTSRNYLTLNEFKCICCMIQIINIYIFRNISYFIV
jgi:hypothetical protein